MPEMHADPAATHPHAQRQVHWDVFCRVIDNYGDVGVCWRLAADLAQRGVAVRLWLDDASALAWMAPQGAPGVSVHPWPDAATPARDFAPGGVVIEAFGCDPPPAFVQAMATRTTPPVWINLEYLSAEAYVERSHGLRSPQWSGPGAGLDKWFFYPGFTARTGGLLREADLPARQAAADAGAVWRQCGIGPGAGEQVWSLFCYANPQLPHLLDHLAQADASPTLLLVTPGLAARQVQAELGPSLQRGMLRAHLLPALKQTDFDALLWSCDVNLVRGEDSFVRTQWADRPFLWQIYPQDDGAHAIKLAAYTDRVAAQLSDWPDAALWQALMRAWNGLGPWPTHWPDRADWARQTRRWRHHLQQQHDLTTQLMRFAASRSAECG
ncbi:MAG: elongation factor maturation arginine rhamnosyltransferase EarP [Pseudomonadota bacterium]